MGQLLLQGVRDVLLPRSAKLTRLQPLQLTQRQGEYLRHLEFAYAVCESAYLFVDRVRLWPLALLLLLLPAAAMLAGSAAWLPRPHRFHAPAATSNT